MAEAPPEGERDTARNVLFEGSMARNEAILEETVPSRHRLVTSGRSKFIRGGRFGGGERAHVVLFYEADRRLLETWTELVREGVAAGEPVVLFATEPHRDAVRALGNGAISGVAGSVTMVDAQEMLSSILVDGSPDPDRFEEVVVGLVERVAGRDGPVRTCEEMVDLLFRAGRHEAALQLERLWGAYARRRSLSLLCAYRADAGYDARYAAVCRAHDRAFHVPRRAALRELRRDPRDDGEAFRLLVESVVDYAMFMLDPKGVVTTWNVGAEKIKGYTASEIVGRHFSAFYPPEEVARGRCERALARAVSEGRHEEEGWRLRKDGTRFWASVVMTALRDADGAVVGFAKVTRDLTERRRAEEDRIRLATAEEATRMRDEFLATLSHELRTPLNAILGWATLLTSQAEDPYTKKAATTIVRCAKSQAMLIDDLLDVSRIVSGKLRLESHPADLSEIVRSAIEIVAPSARGKGIALRTKGTHEPVLLVGDAVRLQQVVWNLLTNAVKFTERGSVTVRLAQRGAWISLEVSDTGAGIDPAFLPHVFERFRQSDDSIGRIGGLGIGLAIVRHLVDLHGGSVVARSEGVGRGSTFSVSLPVRAVSPSSRGRPKAADEASRRGAPRGTRRRGRRSSR